MLWQLATSTYWLLLWSLSDGKLFRVPEHCGLNESFSLLFQHCGLETWRQLVMVWVWDVGVRLTFYTLGCQLVALLQDWEHLEGGVWLVEMGHWEMGLMVSLKFPRLPPCRESLPLGPTAMSSYSATPTHCVELKSLWNWESNAPLGCFCLVFWSQ